jgi:hypothetical protein
MTAINNDEWQLCGISWKGDEMINVAKDDAGCHVEFLNRTASRVEYHTQQSCRPQLRTTKAHDDDD